jgi:hypothetical protein
MNILLEKLNNQIDVVPGSKEDAAPFISKHYLQAWPSSLTKIYIITQNTESGLQKIGMLIYGRPLQSASSLIGKGANSDQVLELKRLYVDDVGIPNIESYCIAKSLKLLKHDDPNVMVVLTYADEKEGHLGKVYQATNAIYLGKIYNNLHKYVYILRGNLKALRNKLQNRPYPK